jgi:hypothetical protein
MLALKAIIDQIVIVVLEVVIFRIHQEQPRLA